MRPGGCLVELSLPHFCQESANIDGFIRARWCVNLVGGPVQMTKALWMVIQRLDVPGSLIEAMKSK